MRLSIDQSVAKKDLRNFGLLVGAVFSIIGIWPLLLRGDKLRFWAIGLGGALIVLGVLMPGVLTPVHRAWMQLGHILGWVNTRILLGIVFYALITPMGILFRLMGKDIMRQTVAHDSPTYRVLRKPRLKGHMKYQF
jgi:Saxitoxin biosynthesis operon protein SxtJ